jgi:hypothetical protein
MNQPTGPISKEAFDFALSHTDAIGIEEHPQTRTKDQ